MNHPTFRISFVVAAFATLSACGGGSRVDAETAPAVLSAQAPVVKNKSYPLVVREGEGAMFTVTAAGTGPVTYQWQHNGIDIAGATGPKHVVAAALLADDGARYSVRISNDHGRVESDVGELLVVDKGTTLPWL